MNSGIEVEELSDRQFDQFGVKWQECLADSEADPIFASWPWCHSWWQTWSSLHALELLLLTVRDNLEIIGIAPLYRHRVRRTLGPSGYQLQFIGNIWRHLTVRSEHTGFILRKGRETEAMRAITMHLRSMKWDDMIICDHSPVILDTLGTMGRKVTLRGQDRGVCIDTTGSFQEWLGSLGSNTRLKLFNRRSYLGGRMRLERVAHDDSAGRESFFRLLCRLHLDRRQAQPEQAEIDFHKRLADCCESHLKPVYCVMHVDGKEVSAIYDIHAGGRRYNLHSVFIGDFDKKVSLGTLHLGYALEEAFQDPAIHLYDFLVGGGKNSFYKEKLKGNVGYEYSLQTSQVSGNLQHQMYIEGHMLARRFRDLLTASRRQDKPGS